MNRSAAHLTPKASTMRGMERRADPGKAVLRSAEAGRGESGMEAPRLLALRILHRVETQASYANVALAAALRRHDLERRERAFVKELVYGVLRHRATLDWLLAACSRRPFARLDPWVKSLLRLGAYQLRFLNGVPEYAAVDATVGLCRSIDRRRAAGFVNAVLRALLRQRDEPPLPSLEEAPATHLSVRASHPRWLVQRWLDQWGVQETIRLCAANNLPPPLSLRVNSLHATAPQVCASLEADGCTAAVGDLHPQALHVSMSRDVRELPSFRDGSFFVQDESSIVAVSLLGLTPGQRALDACAGRGGKTASMAMELQGHGSIASWDLHGAKLRRLGEECRRLGVTIVRSQVVDARHPPVRGRPFDAALVDAPCSGLGVLRRYPDLRWRRDAADPGRLQPLQLDLLTAVADLVRPGGTVVYAVCSTEPEETTGVVERFLGHRDEVTLLDAGERLASLRRGDLVRDGCLLTLPHRHGADGFFAAAFTLVR